MNRERGRDSLQSDLVANDLSVEQEAPSLSLQLISAKWGERSGKRGPGEPRRPTHPRGQRAGGREKATLAPIAPGGQQGPWLLSQTLRVYSLRNWRARKPFAEAPALCASRGRGRGPLPNTLFFFPLCQLVGWSALQTVLPDSAGPLGYPLTLTPAPPRPRGRTDWLGLSAPGKDTPGDWPWVTCCKRSEQLTIGG